MAGGPGTGLQLQEVAGKPATLDRPVGTRSSERVLTGGRGGGGARKGVTRRDLSVQSLVIPSAAGGGVAPEMGLYPEGRGPVGSCTHHIAY